MLAVGSCLEVIDNDICIALLLKQAAEITRIKEHVSRMALMNNNVAFTVLDSGEFKVLGIFRAP